MTRSRILFGMAAALFAGHALAAEPIKLDAATQKRLGLMTAPLAAAHRTAAVHGFARVLDPIPLATLDADISAAVAAAAASGAEAARTQALYAADNTVSAKVAQAAQAQARADAAKLALLRRRLGLEWGPSFTRLSDATRGGMIAAIAAGRLALVRIDVAGPPPAGVRSADLDLGPGGHVRAAVLGPARTGDVRLQSTGLLAQVSGPAATLLGSGMSAPATLATGGGADGVLLPRSALLRTGGQTVAYVRKGDSFEQRRVIGAISDPGGLFVSGGFNPGEAVVTQGASALFAAQTVTAEE